MTSRYTMIQTDPETYKLGLQIENSIIGLRILCMSADKAVIYNKKERETWKVTYAQKWVHEVLVVVVDDKIIMYPYSAKLYLNDEAISAELAHAFIAI